MTVVKVRKRIRLRPGKGSPSCTVSGIEKAMASETTPRIPAQAMTNGAFQVGFGSRSRIRADSMRGRNVAGIDPDEPRHDDDEEHRDRVPGGVGRPRTRPRPFSTTGSCSPISAKTADSRTKATIFQTAVLLEPGREVDLPARGARGRAPTTTTASTPEACTCSAAAYATNGISSESVFCSSGSLQLRAQPVDRHHQHQADADAADRREQELADPARPGRRPRRPPPRGRPGTR